MRALAPRQSGPRNAAASWRHRSAQQRRTEVGVKLQIEDQGDGWFWADRATVTRVTDQVEAPELGCFFKVEFLTPLERQERGGASPSGLRVVTYSGAWLRSRWQGHKISVGDEISAFMWLIEREREFDGPPLAETPSAWVTCRVLA